ncbi:MAG: hypothetical protein ACLP8S_26280 [Solirubrobacteraceae bacterium]
MAAAHTVVDKFRQLRSQKPIGHEKVLSISGIEIYSLHSSRYRGATWHDRDYTAVWLLAYRIHREGHWDDAYRYFALLHQNKRLLPDKDDYTRLLGDRTRRTLPDAIFQITSLVEFAKAEPGKELTVILGDGTRVALVVEVDVPPGDEPNWYHAAIVYITFSPARGMLKGTIPTLVAAALPDAEWKEWEFADRLPHRQLGVDEVAWVHS